MYAGISSQFFYYLNTVKFILAKKLNMSQVFAESGEKIPVTVLLAGPCKVVQVKNKDKDGYSAVQIGFGKKRKLTQAQKGHQKGESWKYLREFRVEDASALKLGQELKASDFIPGEYIDATGIMKGRGFAGAVKRHGFHGAPASHGHDHPRAVGSIGSRYPQHTLKGTRMAGRMGGRGVTIKNLAVLDIDPEKNYLIVSGAVPGASGGLIKIRTTGATAKESVKLYQPSLEQVKAQISEESPKVAEDKIKKEEAKSEAKEAGNNQASK